MIEEPGAEDVRRLLADARATEPMPVDVQSRLDDMLRRLSSERDAGRPVGSPATVIPNEDTVVVDMASRRRRRARTLLVAAAAVTVLGVALPRVLESGFPTGTTEDSTAASDTAAGGEAGAAELGSNGALPEAPESSSGSTTADAATVPRVRPNNFTADAAAARDQAARSDFTGFTPIDPKCLAGTELTAGLIEQLQSIPVKYGQLDAALVLGKASDGTQQATLYVCGESSPRRSTVLSAR